MFKTIFTYPIKVVTLLGLVLVIAYLLLLAFPPTPLTEQSDIEPVIESSLDNAEQLFQNVATSFDNQSSALFGSVQRDVQSGQSHIFIHNRFRNYDFWGASLYKNDELWIWNQFQVYPLIEAENRPGQNVTQVVSYNNIVLLVKQQSFQYEDDLYTLVTAEKLAQTSNLPFTEFVSFSLSNHPSLQAGFPVHFNFISPPADDIQYRTLSTANADSIGIAYAQIEDLPVYNQIKETTHLRWTSSLQAGMFLMLFLAVIIISRTRTSKTILYGLLFVLLGIWGIIFNSDILADWANTFTAAFTLQDAESAVNLFTYGFHSLFLTLIWVVTYSLMKFHTQKGQHKNHYITFGYSLLFGALCVLLYLFFILFTETVLVESTIPLLDLELAPDSNTFVFYLIASIFFTCVIGLAVTVGYYLFLSDEDISTIFSVLSGVGFIVFFYLADLIVDETLFLSHVFLLSSLLFVITLFIINSAHKYPNLYEEMSGFRKLMILALIASISIYTLIWNSSNVRIDRQLLEKANSYSIEETADTDQILFTLLEEFERSFETLSIDEIEQFPALLQSQFQRIAQNIIQDEWRNHSFDLQLITTDEVVIGNYSTNIDPPGRSAFFDTDLMLRTYRGERIRQQTNRPVIWGRPVNLPERYITFSRGWIPVYDETSPGTITAWIAGDAYIERPDFNKPMRAVLSAATPENWQQSFYIAEFLGNRLTRSTVEGLYNNQPQYNRLPDQEADIAARDSISYITNITSAGSFREVLVQKDDRRIIKASTPIPPLNHHLFSFVRLQIVLVFFGLFVFSILAILGFKRFVLFGQSRQFKHRLIDGLTLASIMLLTVLIFATHYAVGVQNEKNVERDLLNKLNSLGESLRGGIWTEDDTELQPTLAELTTSLNVDAIVFENMLVIESTTPQIFQQHLMPGVIPFTSYNFLFNRERRHYFTSSKIGNEELLIGYRTIVDEDGRPAYAVAIPTFPQSPVYREQLLETTSYLFVVYLAIFGLFIIGTVFLSGQLTKPLNIIQKGLNKISRGEDKTEVAVTSRDEIGSLATAYNQMVRRLDEAQQELIKAERESAWKEMAQQVAHEIKNPLTPMKLNLQHLQRQLENNPENVLELKPVIEKTASNIIDQIESLKKIASDFSKFAKPMQSSMERIDVNNLISSVTELYSHDEHITISVNGTRQPLYIKAAEDDLKRAVINLVKNGIEACEPSDAQISISLKKETSAALISIRDNGSGIKTENRDQIFVPNFSTKSSGTGLGLAITKKIIEAHNGDIWFETAPKEGTTFFVKLPLSE